MSWDKFGRDRCCCIRVGAGDISTPIIRIGYVSDIKKPLAVTS
jgi:hypothetical protein